MQNYVHILSSRRAMVWLGKWFLIPGLFCLVTSLGYSQDVLWGLTGYLGPKGGGAAFSLESTGANFQIRKAFEKPDGITPQGSLVQGTDGSFYGMTSGGGSADFGTVFKLGVDGTFTTLKSFNSPEGGYPIGSLVQGTDGFFYGVTSGGGSYGAGTIFKIDVKGNFTTLRHLKNSDGVVFQGSLVQDTDGFYYGMTNHGGLYGGGTIFRIAADGTFMKLKDFKLSDPDGGFPNGSLVLGTNGFFYGMTQGGGTNNRGTVFKMKADGTFIKLKDLNSFEGSNPMGSLVQGSDGLFYGMAQYGGSFGRGTIFKMNDDGSNFTMFKSFEYSDGVHPRGSLVQGTDGFFYGMTNGGGINDAGTIFKIDAEGTFTILRHLSRSDGAYPQGSLIIQKNPVAGCTASSFITREQYNAVNPTGPPVVSTLTSLEATDQGDFFVARILGYICPPLTGNYTFWISGDEATRLTLSPDENPANAQLIAYSFSPTNFREYTKYATQKSAPVYLEAGQKYYIEAQHAEFWDGDHVSVAWQLPNGTFEGPIPGSLLSPYVNKMPQPALAASNQALHTQLQEMNTADNLTGSKEYSVYPNPFQGKTTVEFTLPQEEEYSLAVYDLKGSLIQHLQKGKTKANSRLQVSWEPIGIRAGVYLIKLVTRTGVQHRRVVRE